jgi:hypothetical protein
MKLPFSRSQRRRPLHNHPQSDPPYLADVILPLLVIIIITRPSSEIKVMKDAESFKFGTEIEIEIKDHKA